MVYNTESGLLRKGGWVVEIEKIGFIFGPY